MYNVMHQMQEHLVPAADTKKEHQVNDALLYTFLLVLS
jgi:hypothetical protein